MSTATVSTPTSSNVTPQRISQLAWSYAAPMIIGAAIHNKVFDTLDAGPKTINELSAATGASTRGLAAIMNALVGLELLVKDSHDRYSLTPESAAFLVTTKPAFFGGFFMHIGERLPNWLKLPEIVRTGKPATSVNQEELGSEFFEQLVSQIFPMSYGPAKALAAELRLNKAHVLDLGAGSGVWGIALAQSSPGVRVTALDWPGVLPVTKKTVARFGLDNQFSFIPGDLASADFGSGYDVVSLGHILHSEGETRSRKLLKKIYDALATGGTLAIQEFLVDADRKGPMTPLYFAVNMLVNTDDGDTWSFEEISGWLRDTGFTNPRQIQSPGPSPLILATKP